MASNSSPSVPASSTVPQSSSTSSFVSSFSSPAPTGGPPDGNNGETRIIDDTDPSIIYSGSGWNAVNNTIAYFGTLHQTSCNTCKATLLFNGTGVSLTSLLSSSGSNFVAILDGTSAGAFQLYDPTESTTVVYSIEGLQFGQHNVTFLKSSNDTNDQTLFNIDFITIISRPGASVTGSVSSFVPPTASGRSTFQQTQTGSSPTLSAIPSAQDSSPPPIGAIIGGTVGGSLVIIVIAAWWVLVRRNRSKSKARARRF